MKFWVDGDFSGDERVGRRESASPHHQFPLLVPASRKVMRGWEVASAISATGVWRGHSRFAESGEAGAVAISILDLLGCDRRLHYLEGKQDQIN